MIYTSRWHVPIPQLDLPTYLFQHPTAPISQHPTYIDARFPDTLILTFRAYRDWSKRLALGLQRAGLKPGDRVLLFSSNTVFFPVVFMGVIMAGGIFTGANPGYVARELAYQLKDSGATFLIAAEKGLDTALEAAGEVGMERERVFVFDDGVESFEGRGRSVKGVRHWSTLLAGAEEAKEWAWEKLTGKDELERTVCLNYSSGTTGAPKGVEITHRNYVANCAQTKYVNELEEEFKEKQARVRWLLFLPMYHAMAQTNYGVSAPEMGYPIYVMLKYDFKQFLEAIERFRISTLLLVPPIVASMAKSPLTKKYDLSSVDKVTSGAAPLGMELSREFERLWPNGQINVKQGWGMTEVTCTATQWDPNQTSGSFSVGELAANVEARLVDAEGKDVPKGERGEIWLRGPNIMKGYWNKPKETEGTFSKDGWLTTGDIATIDDKGHVFIVDRMKELIKVKGLQVAPAELESILFDHPDVADAAVIAVNIKDEENPRAYIVKKTGAKASEKDIADYLADKVSKAKRLTGGVKFVDEIPKNPSGKILRKILRERAQEEVGDSMPKSSRL